MIMSHYCLHKLCQLRQHHQKTKSEPNRRTYNLFTDLAGFCNAKEMLNEQYTSLVDPSIAGISSKITQITK
jgi:hypothetical protein